MADIGVQIDLEPFLKLQQDFKALPMTIATHIAAAMREIGRYDIETLKAHPGQIHIRSKGLLGSFKVRATDAARATGLDKIFLVEYTGWKAAEKHQFGGIISPKKGKSLTVLMPAARGANGKRKFTQAELRQKVADGTFRMFKRPNGEMLIVQPKGGYTKTGKMRKGSAIVLIAVLKNRVVLRKTLDFFENFTGNDSIHEQLLAEHLEAALQEVAG